MMLIEPYADKIFSILVEHGNFPSSNGMHLQFKRDEFLYHAARDLTGYQYESAIGTTISLIANHRGHAPLVLQADGTASAEEQAMIEKANAEIQAYVVFEVSKVIEYFHQNVKPEMDKLTVSV